MVEAQLLGIPAIAPNYGNFPNIIWHGKNGFIYKSIDEAYMYINNIQKNKLLQEELKRNSLNLSRSIWCNIDNQMGHWENVFDMCD
jgi:glycosyltransferase involved in cell wall biosynthesis